MTRKPARVLTALALGLALGAALVQPVSAHSTGTLRHLVKHLRRTFYTKAQSNERFLPRSEADFLGAGPITLSQMGPWLLNGDSTGAWVSFPDFLRVYPEGTAFDATPRARLYLTTPAVIGGVNYALQRARICHRQQDSDGDRIANTTIRSVAPSSVTLVEDATPRESSSFSCYTVSPPTPIHTLDPLMLELTFTIIPGGGEAFDLSGTSTTWVPV